MEDIDYNQDVFIDFIGRDKMRRWQQYHSLGHELLSWINCTLLFPDSTPDEQPQQMPEVNERRDDTAVGENRMEVNCNGHASTPESESSLEVQGTKPSTEEQEDQLNANRPESNAETEDTLGFKEEHQTCNGLPGDTDLQQLPASLGPDSVTVELKEGDEEEKKGEEMDTRGETKRGEDEEDDQNG